MLAEWKDERVEERGGNFSTKDGFVPGLDNIPGIGPSTEVSEESLSMPLVMEFLCISTRVKAE